uniref:IkappaB kinase n=2 Tax=Ascaris TaxID=6251 RepID=F1KS66_ASCSU
MVEMSSPVGLVSYTQDYFWTERGTDMVGRGSFGQVHKGRHRETGEFVAVKTCEMHDDVAHQREIALLRSLDSPYIVKYLAAQQLIDGSGRSAIIMELAESNVRDELNKAENYFGLPYEMLILLITHLERGLSYLNRRMVAHRDLKPANILICHSWDGMVFKLCDFGGSRIIDSSTQPLHTICGTPGYLNEYTAANLARNSRALTYTKDECDLWSVGCTIFECATGLLPFLPANGPADSAGMHNMMTCRPPDVVCGHAGVDGTFVWSRELPQDRCSYPESLQRVLCEFLRRLFDRRLSTRLTFEKFSQFCLELTSLRRFKLFLPNTITLEEYFDTSAAVHFERNYFDQDMRKRFPDYDVVCVLAMPSGSATARLSPLLRGIVEQSSQIAVLALIKEKDTFVLPVRPPKPATCLVPLLEDLRDSGRETRFAIANVLRIEQQVSAFGEFVASITPFCDAFWGVLAAQHEGIFKDLNSARKIVDAVRVQSAALSLLSQTPQERNAIENNVRQAVNELNENGAAVSGIGKNLSDIKAAIKTLEAVKIPKHPSQKEKLETVIRNRTIDSRAGVLPKNSLLIDTDCRLVFNSLRNVIALHEQTATRIRALLVEHIEQILRTLFDLSRILGRAAKQFDESMQLIRVSQETNQHRVNATSSIGSNSPSFMSADSSKALKCAKGDAEKQRSNAEESLRETKDLLRDLI